MTLNSVFWVSQVALVIKNLPINSGDIRDLRLIPELGDSLEQGMTIHSSIVAWRILRTEEPGGLQSMGHTELDTAEVT